MARRRLKQTKKARAARRRYREKKRVGGCACTSKKGSGFFGALRNPILVGIHSM